MLKIFKVKNDSSSYCLGETPKISMSSAGALNLKGI